MARIRLRLTKVLEDGTEVELANVFDYPWFVVPVMRQWAKNLVLYESVPAVDVDGQQMLEVA